MIFNGICNMKAIIIGGLGRSGTSILYSWFAADKDAHSFGKEESKFFSEPYGLTDLYRAFVSDYTYARGLVAAGEFRQLMTKHLVDASFTGQPSIIHGLTPEQKTRYFTEVEQFILGLFIEGVPIYLSENEFIAKLRQFIRALVNLRTGRDPEKLVFVEKTPHNALCSWIFGKIFEPVSLIWLIRDPRAVVYSTLKQDWGPNTLPSATEYVRQVIRRYLSVRDSSDHLEIRLEDLVYRNEQTVERIRSYSSARIFPEIDPVRADVIEDWRRYLHGDDLKFVEQSLSFEISSLGY